MTCLSSLPALTAFLLALLGAPARAENVLHLYNWNNYLSESALARFEQRCQCKVKQDYYSNNEEMLAKLEAGATGYDVIVPTGNAVESLIRPDIAADPAIFPSTSEVKKLEMLRDHSAKNRRLLSRMWAEVKVQTR